MMRLEPGSRRETYRPDSGHSCTTVCGPAEASPLAQMVERLKAYQATAVLKGFHTLTGVNCTASSPAKHPEWLGFWMPFCAATAPGGAAEGTRIAEAPL